MRKAATSMSVLIIVAVVIVLLFPIIGGATLNVAKEKIVDATESMRESMGAWLCDNEGSVTAVTELATTMREVYEKCKNEGTCKCQSVVVDSESCWTINKQTLIDNGLSDFYVSANTDWGARIMCCEKDHSPEAEIDVFNPRRCTTPILEQCRKWTISTQAEPEYFKVKGGSKVEIRAITNEEFFGALPDTTDLMINVVDDGQYSSC